MATAHSASDFATGTRVWEVVVYYDDGDDPIANAGKGGYVLTLDEARRLAREWLAGYDESGWYASLAEGQIVDGIGDDLPYDFTFEPGEDGEVVHAT